MGLVHILERGGEDYREYKKHLMTAKKSIEALCDLTESMEHEFGYGERSDRYRGYAARDWSEMDERRSRDSRGRYM